MELLKLCAISLSFWLALVSTLLHIEVWIKRIVLAIREQDVSYECHYKTLSLFWVLFVISILI